MDKCIMDYEQMVMHEIENCITKGELNPTDVKNIGEAVDILKDLYTIDAMKQADYGTESRGYSGARMAEYMEPGYGVSMANGGGNSNRMYEDYDRRSSYRYGRPMRGYARDDMREIW